MILYKAICRLREGAKSVSYALYEVIRETKYYYVIDHHGFDKRVAKESKKGLIKDTKKGAAEGLRVKLTESIKSMPFSPFLRNNPDKVRAIQEKLLLIEKEIIRLESYENKD